MAFRAGRTPVKAGLYSGCSDPRSKLAQGTTNHLYSVAAITNTAGQVVERYSYNAYGVRAVKNPANVVIAKSVVGNDRGFTGYSTVVETGIYYCALRWYSPSVGRFANRDPLLYVEGTNLYMAYFVPNYVDPDGTISRECQMAQRSMDRVIERMREIQKLLQDPCLADEYRNKLLNRLTKNQLGFEGALGHFQHNNCLQQIIDEGATDAYLDGIRRSAEESADVLGRIPTPLTQAAARAMSGVAAATAVAQGDTAGALSNGLGALPGRRKPNQNPGRTGSGVISRIDPPDPALNQQRHAHGRVGPNPRRGDEWTINKDGTMHDNNGTRIPREDADALRSLGFDVPADRFPRPNQ